MLKGKHIVLGITGSIAAYKAAILVRLLVKEGAEVKVIMTPLAKEFITPLTMATLSKNPILVDFFNPENGDWNSHVDLGLWADAYLIAPATANTIGKMAHGIADNLLLTTYLSARCPVFVAPAMDLDMFQHPANLNNLETLKSFGNYIIDPGQGELASGLQGKGRMEEPEKIVKILQAYFLGTGMQNAGLKGKKVLITAGPTYEKIDPVRFIGNYSSGKMGMALAEMCTLHGADVELVLGPTQLLPDHPDINITRVESAGGMYKEAKDRFLSADIVILAAAVSDFKPEKAHPEKMKKQQDNLSLILQPTVDIALELGKLKKSHQIMIGFALETTDELSNAELKLKKKNFDFIVLNSLKDKGAGFQYDTNKITMIFRSGKKKEFSLKPKREVASDIIREILKLVK